MNVSVRRILEKEMRKSNGSARMVKVPNERRPTAESLKKMEDNANEIMRSRSMLKAY